MESTELKGRTVILASQSPRRQELLKNLNIPFSIRVLDDVDESFPNSVPSAEVAEYLAQKKFSAYKKTMSDNEIIITSDTVVCLGDEIIGKPSDKDEALSILQKLSGNTHQVITGVCIGTAKETVSFSDVTNVVFGELSDDEILFYIDTYKPFDKAGAYGIQEWIGAIGIEGINGSYHNVMGLPVRRLYKEFIIFLDSLN